MEALQDRSCAPRSIPHRTADRLTRRVGKYRREGLPAFQIARLLGMPRSTVSAVPAPLGLNGLEVLEPREPASSYEHDRPGDLLHLATKEPGRVRGIGHRIHGDRTTRQRGIGWGFVHVAIDDHSRVAHVEVLLDEKGGNAAEFRQRAVTWFAERLGVRVQRLLTDNGSCDRSKDFRAVCTSLGLGHGFIRPHRPRGALVARRAARLALSSSPPRSGPRSHGERQRPAGTKTRPTEGSQP